MAQNDLLKFHEECLRGMLETIKKKNTDYNSNTDDPYSNFEMVEKLGIAKAEIGFLTRMTDKLSRINSFVQGDKLLVEDEAVQDTLLDLANYCILMAGYIKHKGKNL